MLLLVNVDDVSGEAIPYIIEELTARGASSVHVVQALTKKGRLEYLFLIDAPEERVEALGEFLAAELSTLGLRILETRHIQFSYRMAQARLTVRAGGKPVQALVRVKEVLNGEGQVISVKAEHEDLRAALARFQEAGAEVSLATLKRLAEQGVMEGAGTSPMEVRIEVAGGNG